MSDDRSTESLEADIRLVAFQMETHGKHHGNCVPGRMARIADHYLQRTVAADAEVKRLRGYLEWIATEKMLDDEKLVEELQRIAREALSPKEGRSQ